MTYNQILIRNIRNLLNKSGVKHRVIAERANLTQQGFSDMLNGRKVITAEHVPAIAYALGVKVSDLYAANAEDLQEAENEAKVTDLTEVNASTTEEARDGGRLST